MQLKKYKGTPGIFQVSAVRMYELFTLKLNYIISSQKAQLATAVQNLWWRDRQDTQREGLAAPVPQQDRGRHVFHPCIWMLCRTWVTSPWAPCGIGAGSCWPVTATPSQPQPSWATEDDGGQPKPRQVKTREKPPLHCGHYLRFPALQSSLKQSNKHRAEKIFVSKSDSYKPQFWPTNTELHFQTACISSL